MFTHLRTKIESFWQNNQVYLWLRPFMAIAGIWRVLEILFFAYWTQSVAPFPLNASGFHPLHGLSFELLGMGALSILTYVIWGLRGGFWAIPAFVFGGLINNFNLPLGLGILAIQPFIIWDFLAQIIPARFMFIWRSFALVQVAWIYLTSVTRKRLEIWWDSAGAIEQSLRGDFFPTTFGHFLGMNLSSEFMAFLSRSVVIMQAVAVFIMFLPFLGKIGMRILKVMLGIFFLFHFSSLLLFHFGAFSLACCIMVLLPFLQVTELKHPSLNVKKLLVTSSAILIIFSLVSGAVQTRSQKLWSWGIVQNWAVMRSPELKGHLVFQIDSIGWNSDKLDSDWKMALGYGLGFDEKARNNWLEKVCSQTNSKVEASIYNSSKPELVHHWNYNCP